MSSVKTEEINTGANTGSSNNWYKSLAMIALSEYFIRTGAALAVAYKVKAGASLSQAIDEVLADIKHLGGDGGIIAVDSTGRVEMIYNSRGMKRASVSGDDHVFVATFD